jgi:prepilin-type N-terminal cleavage/methylation domain-containing protein
MRRQAGLTLLEVLIAVTLLSILSVGMMMSMRLGMSALSRTDSKLMDNRRIAGAQRVLEQELEGMIPATAPCGADGPNAQNRMIVFSGQATGLTLVSAFSLQQAWRDRPQVLQLFTIPDEQDGGQRLVVNEMPYTGPFSVGQLCLGGDVDPESGTRAPRYAPAAAGPKTFVLADHLRTVRFLYLTPGRRPEEPSSWRPVWQRGDWPYGIRIEMEPIDPSPGRLQPITVTAPVYFNRNPVIQYVDK